MRNNEDNRRPDEIEDDIERTRAEVSSTIDAIQDKLTPGQLMDQAVAYLRTSAPADFGANLGNTVRDNPVPVALIGVGIAWLMMSGPRTGPSRRDTWRSSPRVASDWYEGDAGLDYDGTYGTDRAFTDDDTSEGALARAREAGEDLKARAGDVASRLGEGASSMGERAKETVEEYRRRMGSAAGGARSRIAEMGHRSQESYHRTRDSVSHLVDEQPLVLGAIGVAIGAALGAALPSTRQEDEWMGQARDEMMEGARSTLREQTESVKGAAERVARTAEEEVNRMTSAEGAARRGPGNGSASRPMASSGSGSATAATASGGTATGTTDPRSPGGGASGEGSPR
jgi:ElaB/YqjD/DUF883 family membrane-anchored ribosome-binding protein